jgi:hypothetical protein
LWHHDVAEAGVIRPDASVTARPYQSDRFGEHVQAHIVEQHRVGAFGERLLQVTQTIDFDLDLDEMARGAALKAARRRLSVTTWNASLRWRCSRLGIHQTLTRAQ